MKHLFQPPPFPPTTLQIIMHEHLQLYHHHDTSMFISERVQLLLDEISALLTEKGHTLAVSEAVSLRNDRKCVI